MVRFGIRKRVNSSVLLVLGMHRSGTSAVTGALAELDFDIGGNLIEPMPENPKGFFEDAEIVSFNNQILRSLNSSWYDTRDVDFSKLKSHSFPQLSLLLWRKTSNNRTLLLKDPRFCLLLPLYLEVLGMMKVDVRGFIVERDCSEVVRSLEKRGQNLEGNPDFMVLCNKYKRLLRESSAGLRLEEVKFSDVISTPKVLIAKVRKLFPALVVTPEETDAVCQFIDPELRNHGRGS